jgi:hypothetical protein
MRDIVSEPDKAEDTEGGSQTEAEEAEASSNKTKSMTLPESVDVDNFG